jgi:hypothetical protein
MACAFQRQGIVAQLLAMCQAKVLDGKKSVMLAAFDSIIARL